MNAAEPRWTVDVKMEGGTNGMQYAAWLYDRGTYVGKPVRGSRKDCESFAALVNGPDLPWVVEHHRDGSLWCLGRNFAWLPEGWQMRRESTWFTPAEVGGHPDGWYEVRPPQEPPTERVLAEAVELVRKALMDRWSDDFSMEAISEAAHAAARTLVAADGTVEVLR